MEPVIPDFAGKLVADARIDFGLHLRTTDDWRILLAAPILVSGPDLPPREIDVDVAEAPLPEELEAVVGMTITELLVADGGHLGIRLGDIRLSVRADDYEAWQIAGHHGERLICMPGGELAYFPPVSVINDPSGTAPRPDTDPGDGSGPAGGGRESTA